MTELEGARESAYLRQVNFYRCPLLAKFLRGHVWTVPGNTLVKFEVRSFNTVALTPLELLAFNAQKFRGLHDRGHGPFSKKFKGSCPDCPWKHACQVGSP